MLKFLIFLHFHALLTCVCPQKRFQQKEVHVKAGDMAVLSCPLFTRNHVEATVKWTSHAPWGPNLTSNMSPAEQMQMGVLVDRGNLAILSVSQHHQGNYSCSVSNVTEKLRLMVTTHSRQKLEVCYTEEECTLYCPKTVALRNVTKGPILWEEERRETKYFPAVTESDCGLYNCTRTYLYRGQRYNTTFTVALDVKPSKMIGKTPAITSPQQNDTVYVDLNSTVVIDCRAVTYGSDQQLTELFWLIGNLFVRDNDSHPIYSNKSQETTGVETRRKATLIIKRVSTEDLSKDYICKLELDSGSIYVTIMLRQRSLPPSRPYLPLALSIICTVVMIIVPALICVKFKIEITLFLRDTLGCHRSSPDGKSYDAFLMCYQADAADALNEPDRQWIANVLEEKFGYSLCLDDRDALPGKAVAEAVLECIEQSRTVLLVPTASKPSLGSGLLSAIHEALVERQTGLVFIKTEAAAVPVSGSVPEALQLLCEAGNCVTWRGTSSTSMSSSFWKQLRYSLPAPRSPHGNTLSFHSLQ
ncbi:interleukin-1 receptor-like 1 isoform X2 [Nelusetta ayraudi]|uniref:interleukin-1 receptor-like 1 isoform X2 n=1 Tax=Nelusetta ayraudi TaxID=303726 RepID=UPI003F72F8F7